MYRISLKLAAVLVLGLLIAACGRPDYEYADSKDVVVDELLKKEVDGFLYISAVLRNNDSDEVTNSAYRVDFYDADGFLVQQTSWHPVLVKGGVPVHIKERSTVPGAKECTIIISNKAD